MSSRLLKCWGFPTGKNGLVEYCFVEIGFLLCIINIEHNLNIKSYNHRVCSTFLTWDPNQQLFQRNWLKLGRIWLLWSGACWLSWNICRAKRVKTGQVNSNKLMKKKKRKREKNWKKTYQVKKNLSLVKTAV